MEREIIVKSIEFTVPRKEAILGLKKELGIDFGTAKQVYEKMLNGGYNGHKYYDNHSLMTLNMYCNWCDMITEPRPLTDEELTMVEMFDKAEAWLATLPPQELEYFNIMGKSRFLMVASG